MKLVSWARSVKARRGRSLCWGRGWPVLWLFTDPRRMPDVRMAVAGLPAGLCGVVFRHDDAPGRPALARSVARLCRARRLVLSVAGDARLAASLQAGLHLRGGRRAPGGGRPRFLTSSAHGTVELRRAQRSGAAAVFLSPVFPTQSHAGLSGMGPWRWAALSRGRHSVYALGGVDGGCARRLPHWCAGAGAIGALLPAR